MNKRLNNIKKSILPYVGSTSPTPSQCYLLFSPFLQWNGVTIIVISAIKLLPVSLCADKSQPYSLLDGLQVNLSIVWQDAAVHFDPPSLYSSRYSCARSRVAWRFHGHIPSGICQLYWMLETSGPMRVCFSTNCVTWVAGAQGGSGKTGKPFSSLTTTPFCRRKSRSGPYRHPISIR